MQELLFGVSMCPQPCCLVVLLALCDELSCNAANQRIICVHRMDR